MTPNQLHALEHRLNILQAQLLAQQTLLTVLGPRMTGGQVSTAELRTVYEQAFRQHLAQLAEFPTLDADEEPPSTDFPPAGQ